MTEHSSVYITLLLAKAISLCVADIYLSASQNEMCFALEMKLLSQFLEMYLHSQILEIQRSRCMLTAGGWRLAAGG